MQPSRVTAVRRTEGNLPGREPDRAAAHRTAGGEGGPMRRVAAGTAGVLSLLAAALLAAVLLAAELLATV